MEAKVAFRRPLHPKPISPACAGINPTTSRARRMSGVGDPACDLFPGLYKTELIKPRGPWRTVEQVEVATLEWVDWFNHRRLYEHNGDIPPVELEQAYYAQNRVQQSAGLSNQ